MFLSTTDIVPGRQYQILGLVKGNVAYTRHIGRDIMAGFKCIAVGAQLARLVHHATPCHIPNRENQLDVGDAFDAGAVLEAGRDVAAAMRGVGRTAL